MRLFREIEFVDGRILRLPYSFYNGEYRFGPLAGAAPMIMTGLGTGMSMGGRLQEGRETKQIAENRAKVYEINAEMTRLSTVEQAKIIEERGNILKEKQKSLYAASGVKMNVGAPLVVEAETNAILAKEKGNILYSGRVQSALYKSQAEIERYIGKKAVKDSIWDTIMMGVKGLGPMAMGGGMGDIGSLAGMFGGGSKASASSDGRPSVFDSGIQLNRRLDNTKPGMGIW